jgi:hypothetical protein
VVKRLLHENLGAGVGIKIRKALPRFAGPPDTHFQPLSGRDARYGLHPLRETENLSIKVDISREEMSYAGEAQTLQQRI